MAFGPRMRLSAGELRLELSPLTKDRLGDFVEGMQQLEVTQYLSRRTAPTIEDEYAFYDKIRAEENSCSWGVHAIEGERRTLIGTTALIRISKKHIHQATSGSMIFRQKYWKRGIASHIHMARTWYAFQHLGLHKIESEVIQGNVGSRRALEKSGYELTHVKRNVEFVNGSLRHVDMLECLNPNELFWAQWWGKDPIPEQFQAARIRTMAAMDWADRNIILS